MSNQCVTRTRLLLPPPWKVTRRFGQWVQSGGGCFNQGTWPQNQQVFLQALEPLEILVNITQCDPKTHGPDVQMQPIGLALCQHDFDEKSVDAK